MVLTVAESMASYSTRNTMVFCLWSGEEGGKRGSDYWTEEWILEDNPNVEVTNYVNLDMAGVNGPAAVVLLVEETTAEESRIVTRPSNRS